MRDTIFSNIRNNCSLAPFHFNYDEFEARQKLKTAGAKWKIKEKVWIVHYDIVKKLGLKKRIIKTTTTKYS